MKVSEIQIGDWVEWMGNKCKVDLPLLMTEYQDNADSNNVKPIPLTAEILEKNGFKKTTDEKYYMCDDYSELSAEEYSDSIWLICCSDIECNLPVQKIMVSYINQLQQFLCLCGEENLAKSLKV